jgi:hypothetical protein
MRDACTMQMTVRTAKYASQSAMMRNMSPFPNSRSDGILPLERGDSARNHPPRPERIGATGESAKRRAGNSLLTGVGGVPIIPPHSPPRRAIQAPDFVKIFPV